MGRNTTELELKIYYTSKTMNKEELMKVLEEEECLTADGFDNALVGFTCGPNMVAVYDVQLMVKVLQEEGMSAEDAVEHLDYNVIGSHVGDKTPQYMNFVSKKVHNG